jgi:methylated-DNA-protein-cysteine methyltransferase related protein
MKTGRTTKPRRVAKPSRTSKPSRKTETRSGAQGEAGTAEREIYAVVRAIPRGKVATYGQIGELIGIPAGHRVVARAMRTCPDGLPWHRVVGKKDARRARISVQDPEHIALQRKLLAREGMEFDASGCIPLRAAGWLF